MTGPSTIQAGCSRAPSPARSRAFPRAAPIRAAISDTTRIALMVPNGSAVTMS